MKYFNSVLKKAFEAHGHNNNIRPNNSTNTYIKNELRKFYCKNGFHILHKSSGYPKLI